MSKPRCKTASQIDFNAFWHYIKPKPDRASVVHRSSGAATSGTSMGLGYSEPFPFRTLLRPRTGTLRQTSTNSISTFHNHELNKRFP